MEELRADRSGSSTTSPLRGRDERSSLSGSIAASDRGGGTSKVHKPHLDEMHGPIPAPSHRSYLARKAVRQRKQDHSAYKLKTVRPRIRPRPAFYRRRSREKRWVEEAVGRPLVLCVSLSRPLLFQRFKPNGKSLSFVRNILEQLQYFALINPAACRLGSPKTLPLWLFRTCLDEPYSRVAFSRVFLTRPQQENCTNTFSTSACIPRTLDYPTSSIPCACHAQKAQRMARANRLQ